MYAWIAILLIAWSSIARADDCESIPVWRDGEVAGTVCRADAAARGLTVVDLGEDWVPPVLAAEPDGMTPAYRAVYLALAQERFGDAGLDGELAKTDRYLELYGIEPTLAVVRARLADARRHRCHDAIDDRPLAEAPGQIGEESKAEALARATSSKRYREAVRTAQAHLACDHLFEGRPLDGAYTWQTSNAVERFQKGAMILPTGALDAATRAALAGDARDRDFATALRVLRARVIAATGLVEDGTAGAGEGRVLGLALEPEATWRVLGGAPLDGAAPDLVSAATESAARALGWTSAGATLAWLSSTEQRSPFVAIALPALPAYHARVMQLEISIERGDAAGRRPALVVYARDGERLIALARWPTTVGGWQDTVEGELIVKDWKESPAGPRVWRDLYVGPSWLPPLTIPDRELVRATDHGYVLARELLGPSYRSAYGFVALVHLTDRTYEDEGIRTHATANLTSLARGTSHGCHRLLGLHAVRLADFLLAHHEHVARGVQAVTYHRTVREPRELPVSIDTLGYQIELVPPVPVTVSAQ